MSAPGKQYYCTVGVALDRLKGKWKPAIIYHLKTGVIRFGDLKRRIPGISTKMLTLHLRELESDDIVRRTETRAHSPREVSYALSTRAAELLTVLDQLHRWGSRYAHHHGIRTTVTYDDPITGAPPVERRGRGQPGAARRIQHSRAKRR